MFRHTAFTLALGIVACGLPEPEVLRCGPSSGVVERAVDGDTIELESGEKIRYLLIDTPELKSEDCFADEATTRNAQLVVGQNVDLIYDVECTDRFDRLLAYVYLDDTMINRILVAQGYAEVLHIEPNGAEFIDEFDALESSAKESLAGQWGVCQ